MKIAVIPARGGSKRIPRKNIRPFVGKPIISYSIKAGLETGLFDRVIVSTDDPEIAAVAVEYGAETPFVRPAALTDDHTGTNAVVKHAIQWATDHGQPVTHACCIYATAPFIEANRLQEALRLVDLVRIHRIRQHGQLHWSEFHTATSSAMIFGSVSGSDLSGFMFLFD